MRRTEAQIQHLPESGLECWVVEVSDPFGDYGLVGVLIFSARHAALEVDTFLLSCRVLNRGVEHRMLNELGKIALERGLPMVVVTLVSTKKNQPAVDFLESVVARFRQEIAGSSRYNIPAADAANAVFSQSSAQSEVKSVLPNEARSSGCQAVGCHSGSSGSPRNFFRLSGCSKLYKPVPGVGDRVPSSTGPSCAHGPKSRRF